MSLFVAFHILICLFMVVVILLQPGKGDAGIGFGSSSQSIFGSKGAGNFLTKTTSICAILFLCTSFILTRTRVKATSGSVIGNEPAPQTQAPATTPAKAPEAAKPAAPAAEASTEAPAK